MALITALLVVFLATLAAVQASRQQQLLLNRSQTVLEQRQAWLYALGAEEWVGEILRRDLEDDTVDSLQEVWAQPIAALPIEGGALSGEIIDLQGRFNLNGLLTDRSPDEIQVERFRRLLGVLGLPENLGDAVVDWLDPDSEPRFPDGAEDSTYLALTPARLPANGPFRSVEELRAIHGFDEESFQTLEPHVAVLPVAAPLNVNTASREVLQSLAADLDEGSAEALGETQQNGGFDTVENFLSHEALGGLEIEAETLGVSSTHFLARIRVQRLSGNVFLESLISRSPDTGIRVLQRRLRDYP